MEIGNLTKKNVIANSFEKKDRKIEIRSEYPRVRKKPRIPIELRSRARRQLSEKCYSFK